ncbi:hypothetical protein HEP85_41420 [Streptomyces sp. RPA4-2]|uniref:hypothetical protein n=1 Tax=Streptomyces sp. RPA4-2 TaxID=2721244 RepID=UPI00143E81EA|nr:hypothetical protein [Streptomyces sp. RPA4-2]QIY66735.1 hypothetical protein HEP85_41420 [Streptomyces sp. RPA4-2]
MGRIPGGLRRTVRIKVCTVNSLLVLGARQTVQLKRARRMDLPPTARATSRPRLRRRPNAVRSIGLVRPRMRRPRH